MKAIGKSSAVAKLPSRYSLEVTVTAWRDGAEGQIPIVGQEIPGPLRELMSQIVFNAGLVLSSQALNVALVADLEVES